MTVLLGRAASTQLVQPGGCEPLQVSPFGGVRPSPGCPERVPNRCRCSAASSPTMTSADFSPITMPVSQHGASRSPRDAPSMRSPRISTQSVPAQPLHLRFPRICGLRHVVLTRPRVAPCMQFLFVGSRVLLPASFPRSVALPQLPSAHSSIRSSCRGLAPRGSPHKTAPMSGVHHNLDVIAESCAFIETSGSRSTGKENT
jgi:hypothetical protein